MLNLFKKTCKYISIFIVISEHWDGVDSWNCALSKARTHFNCIFKYSTQWLLMSWLCKEPRHRQPLYLANYPWLFCFQHQKGQTTWASCQIRKIPGAHAPGMPGTFSPLPQVSDPDMHHGTCVTHVPWCMSGSLTSGFLWNRRRGKTFPAFPAHAQPAILCIW